MKEKPSYINLKEKLIILSINPAKSNTCEE